jgi:hypothetical protein
LRSTVPPLNLTKGSFLPKIIFYKKFLFGFHVKRLFVLAAILFLASVYYWAYWRNLDSFVAAVDRSPTPILFWDYYTNYVPAAQEFVHEGIPAPGFYYSPFFAMLLLPLTKLQADQLFLPWLLVQGLAIIALFLIPCFFLRKENGTVIFGLYCAVFSTCYPILHNFKFGQVSVLLNASMLLSAALYAKGRRFPAALALSVPIAIKFYFAFFLTIFLLKRDWKFVAQCVLLAACFGFAFPALFIGMDSTVFFYIALFKSIYQAPYLGDTNSQFFASLAVRFCWKILNVSAATMAGLRLVFAWVGVLIALTVLIVEFVTIRKANTQSSFWWCLFLTATLTPFLVPTAWPHYFVFLPAGQLFLLLILFRKDSWLRRDLLILWFALIPSVLLAGVPLVTVIGHGRYSFAGCLFLSNLALMLGLLMKVTSIVL